MKCRATEGGELRRRRGSRERKRYIGQGWGKAETRCQELYSDLTPGWQGPKYRHISKKLYQDSNQHHDEGCWHCRWQLNPLIQKSGLCFPLSEVKFCQVLFTYSKTCSFHYSVLQVSTIIYSHEHQWIKI